MTDRQGLVAIDERFIRWITEVDTNKDNLQFQPGSHKFVFVRIWAGKAVDIQGIHELDDAIGLLKTVGPNLHEGFHVFTDCGIELEIEYIRNWKEKK